jgi:hypothetical protein
MFAGAEPCLNIPVSSAIIRPVSCVITGPRSVVVTGSVPGAPQDGTAVTVDGQRTQQVVSAGSGRLSVDRVSNGRACMWTAMGQSIDLDMQKT